MTIEGRNTAKELLFTHDLDVPPQVDRENPLVNLVEMIAFITTIVMGSTIILAFLLDLIFFRRYEYHALWQAVEVWQ